MKSIYSIVIIFLLFINCNSVKNQVSPSVKSISKKNITEGDLLFWYQKDNQLDSFPGISLDKWYDSNNKKPKRTAIIVAVIDSQIDLQHEDLQEQIWTNTKEIANNGIDDDNNGYIDDIHGWSFIGTKSGGNVVWGNFEFIRIIREWNPFFKDKSETQIPPKQLGEYREYQRALKELDGKASYYQNYLKSLKYGIDIYPLAKDTLKHYFPKEDYTYQQLDSMYQIYGTNEKTYWQKRDDNDKDFSALIHTMMVNVELKRKSINDLKDKAAQQDSILNKNLNVNYDERKLIDDNPNVLEKGYGNNKNSNYRRVQDHCTEVSGIIAANRTNNKGIKGFSNNIKIMPLNISPSGDEHDKDIAMAIRYAVDNGAKVINMSFGKEFSLHKEWVSDAFKYAEEHNVLLVLGSGNNAFNVDKQFYYPTDYDYDNTKEICTNAINVGSISHKLDSTFVSAFSNYGKQNVDLFAPGEKIYTTIPENKYKHDSGTSLSAPMVSGTAALIWLYYPKLTVNEVKKIILDSGTAYDIEVIVPGTKDKKVSFSELSKSGRVLNVYNAMQMAKVMSNKKL